MSIPKVLEILERAHTGPIYSLQEWDMQRVPSTIKEKLEKFDLVDSFAPDDPVNTDDDLADRFFKAGYEASYELGVYCQDTERVIEFSEGELLEAIGSAQQQLPFGLGKDRVVMRTRQPEDGVEPISLAPLGLVVSEEYFVPLHTAIAMHKEVDILVGGSLQTVLGYKLRGGTPFETLAGRYSAQLYKDALWQAGRPDMPIAAVVTSPTCFGQLGGFGVEDGFSTDQSHAIVLAPSEMKTTFDALHKVVQAVGLGATIFSSLSPMIGGYAGSPEGAAIAGIAWGLAQYVVHLADYGMCSGMDIRLNCNTNRAGIWTLSTMAQAFSRNTDVVSFSLSNQLGGSMTEMLLLESAAIIGAVSASGASSVMFPRTAGGKYADRLSPLECKFSGEVLKAAAGLTRSDVNEIVKQILPRYEDKLREPDIGARFSECYDLATLTPKPEWQDIYDRIKSDVIELGIPLKA